MLRFSFCGMGGLERDAEETLWRQGVWCWNDYRLLKKSPFSPAKHKAVLADLDEAEKKLAIGRPGLKWFYKKLPAAQLPRLYPYIRDRIFYVDVETTGLNEEDVVTVLSIYDGAKCQTYTRGVDLTLGFQRLNLDAWLVTFNGTTFDLPRLRREYPFTAKWTELDLRKILYAWGFKGGLKRIEKSLGVSRDCDEEIDGAKAAELWREFENGDLGALETLRNYNRQDVLVLERILKKLYNLSMKDCLFFKPI